ncbi:putative Intradiol ring-cleavage dioxygenase [Seiridium unicorne]|uniref:Intradiol ring-cleavage dioxygenase n=1 Tax=Seiridium unicorne TaxID=138068 RepID=A0ABR2UPH1_9PEZI
MEPLSAILALAAFAAAHPGHEAEERRSAFAARACRIQTKRALEKCAASLQSRGIVQRGFERRAAGVARQRISRRIPTPIARRDVVKRDVTSILNKDHQGTLDSDEALTDESYVFNSTTCVVLNPEGEVGPFYVQGEYVRDDLRNDEPGVEIILEAQLIHVNNCELLASAWFDIWSCNSTGVYSGVQSSGNGNSADATNLDNTALCGIQQSDDEGVVTFTSIYPGHYSGRTNHMHAVVYTEEATELANGTLSGGTVPRIGQFCWDQSLFNAVEALSPLTTNAGDHVFGEQETTDTTSDPAFDYVYLGDTLSEGIFQWIIVGIDPDASYTPTYSFELTESGGVAVGSGSGGSVPGTGGPQSTISLYWAFIGFTSHENVHPFYVIK